MKKCFMLIAFAGLFLILPSCDSTKSMTGSDMPSADMSMGDMQGQLDNPEVQMKLKEALVNNDSEVRDKTIGYLKKNPDAKEKVGEFVKENPKAKGKLMDFIFNNPELQKLAFDFIKNNPKILQQALALIGM